MKNLHRQEIWMVTPSSSYFIPDNRVHAHFRWHRDRDGKRGREMIVVREQV